MIDLNIDAELKLYRLAELSGIQINKTSLDSYSDLDFGIRVTLGEYSLGPGGWVLKGRQLWANGLDALRTWESLGYVLPDDKR